MTFQPTAIACFVSLFCFSLSAQDQDATDQLETIEVKGTQHKEQLVIEQALTPGAVTVINSNELYERNAATLADMLRYVPGVWVASGSTGDSSFFSSRGSNLDATGYDGNGIKLLQDGLPVTAADGNNHNRSIDPLSSSYAVVARGANALTYGASTLGGAIDFISPTARDLDAQEIYLNGGSNGLLQGRLTASTVADNLDAVVTLDSRNQDGYREHHQQRRSGVYANAGWKVNDRVQTRFYLTSIDNDQELPGALTAEEFADDPYQAQPAAKVGHYQYNVKTWRLANKTSWDLNANSSLSLGFSYEEQSLYHPIVYSPFFSLLIDTDQNNAGTALRYNLRLGSHDLLAGLNYAESTVKGGNYNHEAGRRTNLTTKVDNDANNLELFLVDRWHMAPQWTLMYGLQAVAADREVRNTSVATNAIYNPEADYHSINPRVGLIYQLSESTELFSNLSRLYEAPTNYELEDDASPDNVALKAMQGEVIEFGSRGQHNLDQYDSLQWELAVYYARLRDEILSVDDPAAPGTSLSTNVDDTIHAGVEALIAGSFVLDTTGVHRIEPRVSLTLNKFSFDNDASYGNNKLPAAPEHSLKAELIYRHSMGYFAGPTFDVVDKRYADFSNSYTVDSYNLIGFRAGYASDSWEVYAEARNLADKDYVSVFSVKDRAAANAAILQAGEPRSMYLGSKIRF